MQNKLQDLMIQNGKLTKLGCICLIIVIEDALIQFFRKITENEKTTKNTSKTED